MTMEDPLVKLSKGSVRGLIENHEDGFGYYSFKGIPYGEPPIGKLRFKDPVAKKAWPGVWNCQEYVTPFLQHNFLQNYKTANEDSLYLNVYTRSINEPTAKKAVMMIVHGGACLMMSGDDTWVGHDYLIRQDVVVVTCNYRLGVLGFLNLEDELAAGNQGLKDQIMVLKWIQENIEMFGGDPKNVTTFGISGGASIAHCLAISPATKGLMHKIISQSCVMMNDWTSMKNPKSIAIRMCKILGCESTDPKEMFQFLVNVDANRLLEAQEQIRISEEVFIFGPSMDSHSDNPMLPVDPRILANEGVHLPYMVGHSAREGLFLTIDGLTFKGQSRESIIEKWNDNPSELFNYNGKYLLERYGLSIKQALRLYYKSERISVNNLDNFIDLKNDLHFVVGMHEFVRVQAERSSAPTYMFVFDYNGPNLLSKAFLNDPNARGPCHLDDAPYVCKMKFMEMIGVDYHKKGTMDYRIMEQMTTMWTNFAKYGKPTVETTDLLPVNWLPISSGTVIRYLSIDEDLLMKSCLNVDQKLLSARHIRV